MKKLNLWTILIALFMAFGMAACSEKDDVGPNETDVPKPPATVADDDWQDVSSSGGTIEKDDISITFPSGTFSSDTKVAISSVDKGKIYGDLEVSPFYQITMPITTKKATTIKIKSQELNEDVSFIFHSVGYALSSGKYVETNNVLDATYSNGEYSVTLPVFDNGDETTTNYFAIGLAQIESLDDMTRAKGALEEGSIKGIKWQLLDDPSAKNSNHYQRVVNYRENQKIKQHIIDAITTITDMGFALQDKDRVIKYYYSDTWNYGEFSQNQWSDSYNHILLGVPMIGDDMITNTKSNLDVTVLHETFHLFQADYDPRCSARKAGGLLGYSADNQNILYEIGAVWMEQFKNSGQLSADWLKNVVFKNAFHKGSELKSNKDKLGFGLEVSRWGDGNNTGVNRDNCNQQQGYTMSPWLYYMTTQMKDYGFSNSSVLELHKLWRTNWKSDTHNAYHILNDWVKLPNHNAAYIFDSNNIDDYYLMLLQGNLVKDFSIGEILKDEKNFVIDKVGKRYDLEGQCYAFGCGVRKILLNGFKNVSLEDKKLVVKQECPNVHTYMAITQKKTNHATYNLLQRSGVVRVIEVGDSMVVKGSVLEQLRESDGSIDTHIYLITTNTYNNMFDWDINPFKVSIELKDKEKEPDNALPGSVFKVQVAPNYLSYWKVRAEHEWKDSGNTYYESVADMDQGHTIDISNTSSAITFNANATSDDGEIKISFDIVDFANGFENSKINNLKLTDNTIGSGTYRFDASNIKCSTTNSTTASYEGPVGTYKMIYTSKVSDGLIIEEATRISDFFYKYIEKPDNSVTIYIFYRK